MIKAIVFDFDGMIYHSEYFSARISRDYNIPSEKVMEFFKNEFNACKEGKLDLKQVLQKYLPKWGWKKSMDELLEYWFSEGELDLEMISLIKHLREKGIICILGTSNEKYRMKYLIEKYELDKIFDHIVTSYDIGAQKPDKRVFDKFIEITGLGPEEILFCDDKDVSQAKGFSTHLYKGIKEFKKILNEI